MKPVTGVLLLMLVVASGGDLDGADGFVPIFDGETLDGWHALPGGNWSVENGVIVGTSPATEKRHGLLVTDDSYHDFDVRAQFRVLAGDSGFYFRIEETSDHVGCKGFQVEIDSSAETGGLYETGGRAWVKKPDVTINSGSYRPGEWSTLELRALGKDVTVRINGVLTARLTNDKGRRKGPLALQLHGSMEMHVQWRNIEVRELDPKNLPLYRPPNILWILAEDIGPDLSCYGCPGVSTPHLDRLASEGVRFERCFSTSPVCSPSRSAMITGMHQNAIGAHQHRTRPRSPLPSGVRTVPAMLRDVGYFTALGCVFSKKTDLNFDPGQLFDGVDWVERQQDQPFFGQGTIQNTHRPWRGDPQNPVDPAAVSIPPCYPDEPLVRADWALGLGEVQVMDRKVGRILDRLESDGLADDTMVIFVGDNGRCQPRGKQFLYDGGIHVPLIIRWPGRLAAGAVRQEMVSTIDLAATILDVAGVPRPRKMHGRSLLDATKAPPGVIFAARDKMDSTHDAMRALRTRDFKYILNLMPERPWCQYNQYKEQHYPVLSLLLVKQLEGTLSAEEAPFMAMMKPSEEIYDLRSDPGEVNNLAADPARADLLAAFRQTLGQWRREIGDEGVTEEFRQGGWSSSYPTRNHQEWTEILERWQHFLLEGGPRPQIPSGPPGR